MRIGLLSLVALLIVLHTLSSLLREDDYGEQPSWLDHQISQTESPVVAQIDGNETMEASVEHNRHKQAPQQQLSVAPQTGLPANVSAVSTRKPSIVIAGLSRNSEKTLFAVRRAIQRVMRHFDLFKIVIFENDSVDKTREILTGWKKVRWLPGRKKLILITEDNLRNVTMTNRRLRTPILAYCRNRLWKEIQNLERRDPNYIDYVLLMDMDEVNFDLNNVEECLNLPSNWTGCCANSYTIYYDLWALRSVDNWLPDDIQKLHPKYHSGKYRHIPADHPPIPVKSCFGGAALYDFRQIHRFNLSTYSGIKDGQPACEHVEWYEKIREQQSKLKPSETMQLYIQPKMMNRGPERLRARKPIMDAFRGQWEASWNNSNLSTYYRLVVQP